MIPQVDDQVSQPLPLHLLQPGSCVEAVLESKDLLLQVFLKPLPQLGRLHRHLLSLLLEKLAGSLQRI